MPDLDEKFYAGKQLGPDIVINTILLMVYVIPFSFYSAYSVKLQEPKVYEPDITNIMKFPPSRHVPADFDIIIYAKITDRYSDIKNATLTYADDRENISRNAKMQLINGTFSNGTFRGAIPGYTAQYYGSKITYRLNFSDQLNYTTNYSGWFIIHQDSYPPNIKKVTKPSTSDSRYIGDILDTHNVVQGFNTTISIRASDLESGVKNVTFYYYHTNPPLLNSSIKMKLIDGDKWDGIYEGIIPKISQNPSNYNLSSSFKAFDFAGHYKTKINIIYYNRPWWPEILDDFFSEIKFIDVNMKNHTAQITINVEAPVVNNSHLFDPDILAYGSPYGVVVTDDDRIDFPLFSYTSFQSSLYSVPKDSNLTSVGLSAFRDRGFIARDALKLVEGIGHGSIFTGKPVYGSISLLGSPSSYPFDHYHAHLYVGYSSHIPKVPIEEQNVLFGEMVNASWNAIVTDKSNNTSGYGPLASTGTVKYGFLVDFKRNYTILIVIIPLLAIFYLLGASFIFDNTLDRLGNRLALTLGIIGLIFTLNSIINQNKPFTSSPTIAESLLSIAIMAAIVFPISSILSSSPIIQKRFRRLYGYIDVIIFLVMTGITITLLSTFDLEVTKWLLPVIIFGLGYGLLMRKIPLSKIKSIMLVKGNPNRHDYY